MARRALVLAVLVSGCGGTDSPPDVDLTCKSDPNLTALEQQLIDLPADSWLTLPGTALDPWCRSQGLPENGEPTAYRCGNVVLAWGGGAFDPARRQLILFGGGHNDYAGNEVYGFDLASGAWQLLRPPTPDAQIIPSTDAYADGTPVSRHSYDGFAYLTDRGELLVYGGSRFQDGSTTAATWRLASGSLEWSRGADFPPSAAGIFYMGTAYDEATHSVLARTQDGLFAYDVAGDAWARLVDFGYPPYWPELATGNYRRAVVVPDRRLYVAIGGETASGALDLFAWDLAAGTDASAAWVGTGDDGGARESGTGADYDRAADAIVTWSGGAPDIFDLATARWSRGASAGAPPAQVDNGTYGRWRYVAYLNVFVLVNEPTDDVHVYKHTAGCGPAR